MSVAVYKHFYLKRPADVLYPMLNMYLYLGARAPPRSVRSLEAIFARQPTWPHYGAPLHLCLHGPTVTHPRHTTCRLHLPRHTICQGRDTTALSVQSHITTLSIDAQANDTSVTSAKACAEAT